MEVVDRWGRWHLCMVDYIVTKVGTKFMKVCKHCGKREELF